MFALQNLNIILNNLPQMSTAAKYGMFQGSSLTTVKKIPELESVCAELAQTVQLIKELKFERFVDALAGLKPDTNIKGSDWMYIEDHINKLVKGKRKDSSTHHSKHKEAASSVPPVNDCNKISDVVSSENSGNLDAQPATVCFGGSSLLEQIKSTTESPPPCAVAAEDSRKPPSIISQLMTFKNVSNQSIFKNSSLYVNPGGGFRLRENDRRIFPGQRRGFKTERQVKIELEQGLVGTLRRVFELKGRDVDVNAESHRPERTTSEGVGKEALAAKDDRTGARPKTHLFGVILKYITDMMRLLVWIVVLSLAMEAYHLAFSSGKFAEDHVPKKVDVTFDDAKGMDEAKAELRCVVEFLRDPSKFMYLGGKLPAGILLQGPPGTGKTLLARAVAGEANVQFFHMSGSEFDELLVGEGAKRVRNLFRTARMKAPAVIFIDEIDAVGARRVSSSVHPFANQTIIQLLAEMDGFVQNDKIVVIGATNRGADLDEALLRPGRFDLKIQLNRPDIKGRRDILKLYLKKIVYKDIDVEYFAKRTVGFSGADLENLINQAALSAATAGCDYVTTEHMDQALEKIMLGPALKSMVRTEQMNKITAYHESGHALVAYFTPNSSPPIKISIIPRGSALGHTALLAEERPNYSKSELLALIDVKMGGRAAEELIFGPEKVTSGCQDDLDAATHLATKMVRHWGMSEKVGLRTHRRSGDRGLKLNEWGQATGDDIDQEIKKIIQDSYERAKKILKKHAKEHKLLAERLLEKETLEAEDIKEILGQGREEDGTPKEDLPNK